MGLRLRHLALRVRTDSGMFGADIPFASGLNVLWADNTKGKSTCVQSIVFALGLERMLSAQRDIPLQYAMTDYVREVLPEGGEAERSVVTSAVWLEIESDNGAVITIRRWAKSAGQSSKLITVFQGPILTEGGPASEGKDYFVHDAGAATREAGFHAFLATFLGWDLPLVSKFDGREAPLYLETLFPLFYVEQKVGWAAFPAAFPTYLGIRDMGRKAVEFVLGLDTHENELERERLQQELASLRAEWAAKVAALSTVVRSEGGELWNLPKAVDVGFDELALTRVAIDVDGEVQPLETAILALREKLNALRQRETRTSEEVAPEVEEELRRQADALASANARRAAAFQNRSLELAQLDALRSRLASVERDLKKNQDAKKLQGMGSTNLFGESLQRCPTCEQELQDALLSQEDLGPVMSLDQNIGFLQAQRGIFRSLMAQSERNAERALLELDQALAEANDLSARIRALKADLVNPANAPSESDIENRVRWDRRIRSLESLQIQVQEQTTSLKEISAIFIDAMAVYKSLAGDRLSEDDQQKIDLFVRLIQQQLGQYGFTTFAPTQLGISDNFRLEKEGFEIGFQSSASDSIRLKWAYQLALLEVARTRRTNHLGVVIFDEPRQQEAAKTSFQNLLRRASSSEEHQQQVFFATSEDLQELRRDLQNIPANLTVIEGWTIKRLPGATPST